MTDPSDQYPSTDPAEKDTTSPDYLLGLKHAQEPLTTEQYKSLAIADPESDEVRRFMDSNGLEFGDDVIVTVEDGRSIVMGTERGDFGTSDRLATNALNDMLRTEEATPESSIETAEIRSEQALEGQKDLATLAAESTVAQEGQPAPTAEGATISRLQEIMGSTAEAQTPESVDPAESRKSLYETMGAPEPGPEKLPTPEELARKEKSFLRSEITSLTETVLGYRSQYPDDVEGQAVQHRMTERARYYASLKDRGEISPEGYDTLVAMSLGAAKDVDAARRTYLELSNNGILNEDQLNVVLDQSVAIDRHVRSERRPDQATVMAIMSRIEKAARDGGEDTPYGHVLLAMAGGLATHLEDPAQVRQMTASAWGNRI